MVDFEMWKSLGTTLVKVPGVRKREWEDLIKFRDVVELR